MRACSIGGNRGRGATAPRPPDPSNLCAPFARALVAGGFAVGALSLLAISPKRQRPRRGQRRWTFAEWEEITIRLLGRDGDRCPWCGQPLRGQVERHHRKRRRDTDDCIENVVMLHPACHATVTVGPAEAIERGFIVPFAMDPAEVPIDMRGFGWALLTPEGVRVSLGHDALVRYRGGPKAAPPGTSQRPATGGAPAPVEGNQPTPDAPSASGPCEETQR